MPDQMQPIQSELAYAVDNNALVWVITYLANDTQFETLKTAVTGQCSTNQSVLKSGVRLGRRAPRISKRSAIWNNLRRRCRHSLAALLAEEIYRSALRIVQIFRKKSPNSRRALVVPPYPDELAHLSLPQESEYLSACNEDIQRLSGAHRWAGNLDLRMGLEAHLMGAAWSTRNGISKCDESRPS